MFLPKLLLAALLVGLSVGAESPPPAAPAQRGGDGSNRCEWLDTAHTGITRFSVLPGGGWDNLRNRHMGLVADLSFSDCVLSDDGTFVTPSHVILYPKRESQVSLMSHVIEHYENYTSSTSFSVNLGGNGIFHGIGIDGKFSEEYQEVKKTVLTSKTQIGRTQQRYNMYAARLQPDFKLSDSFTNRLIDIANAQINGRTGRARYLADLVVRDFGTHMVTSVDAGAILEKMDYFNRNSLTSSVFTKNKLSQCLSVSFAKVFGLNFDSSLTVTKEHVKQYIDSVQMTTINTHGGPPIGAKANLTVWEARLRENLVAIDKIGEPLFGVISERSLPQIPPPRLENVIEAVKEAVLRYYKANEVKGCQDPNSANFDPLANIDGVCEPTMTNFSFAGVYQTCRESNPGLGLNLCGRDTSPSQKNPITGDYRCPAGYEPVKLLTLTGSRGSRCFERHKSCWLVFSCHAGTDCYESTTTLDSFWCAASRDSKLPPSSGMTYGGAYSPRFSNPATDAKTCGDGYRPYAVARDIRVCLSADMHPESLGSRLPLGGLFTCQAGNPLAEAGRHIVTANSLLKADGAFSADNSPKRCPDGFTQSTIDVIDGCELMQCVLSGSDRARRSVIKRPPFETADFNYAGPPVDTVETDGRRWGFNGSVWFYEGYYGSPMSAKSTKFNNDANNGAASIFTVIAGVAAVCLAVVLVGLLAYKKRSAWLPPLRRRLGRRRAGPYQCLNDDASDALVNAGSGSYGTVAPDDAAMETPPMPEHRASETVVNVA
ncbi:hypothetical protein BOX15_Mlig024937g2 [Macrostomum lignano]|uniref:MACPF domain-containing protein n=1 Tax=Macrostomum lignano TaxID=282301 RepID=A0A267GCG8_9PLAT|nr:hypothetical protein BOX15_Mlig024937g2 [Macrostomum lignano]